MKFLDSNIIAYAFYENANTEACQKALQEGGICNTLNLIEAFNIIEYQCGRDHAKDCIKSLLKSNLEIIEIDINVIFEALKRTEKYKLNFLDLIHYTTAVLHECKHILSYDKDFDGLEIARKEP